jgi:hypothetical protein
MFEFLLLYGFFLYIFYNRKYTTENINDYFIVTMKFRFCRLFWRKIAKFSCIQGASRAQLGYRQLKLAGLGKGEITLLSD